MKNTSSHSLVKALLRILPFFAFGAVWIYFGYQTIEVKSTKNPGENAVFCLTQERYWGLLKFTHHIERVKKADIRTRSIYRKSTARHITESKVVLITYKEETKPLIGWNNGLSLDFNSSLATKINSYIQDPHKTNFGETIEIRNYLSYWTGLIFWAVGIFRSINSLNSKVQNPLADS